MGRCTKQRQESSSSSELGGFINGFIARQNGAGDGRLAGNWSRQASALAEAGAHVLVHYGRSAQDAESLVAGLHAKGGRAEAIKADLGTADGATLLARQVRSIVG